MKKRNEPVRTGEIIMMTLVFVFLFLGLMGYLVYYEMFTSENVVNSPYNRRRQELLAEKVVRGNIETADGKIIAETKVDEDGNEERVYPYGTMFAHVGGYSMNGGSGLEAFNNVRLLTSHVFVGKQFSNKINEEKSLGDNVITTLDYDLQKVAYEALGSNRGAVVVMEPDTGKVLAMVSKPYYDPNKIEELWDSFLEDTSDKATLLNRATQGQYPPGSTFKILTLIEYMRENPDADEIYVYECKGKHSNENGDVINCYHNIVHGSIDLKESFSKSCNSSFVNIGLSIDRNKLVQLCKDFGFDKSYDRTGLASKNSQITLSEKTSDYKLMQTVIGQGDTLVTPLQMAIVSAAIVNDGVAMEPYLVDHIENADGKTIRSYGKKKSGEPITKKESALLREYMEETVQSGTAKALASKSYTAGGKTGSAEFGTTKGQSHGWFTGYATQGEQTIAISVIVEGAGSGSQSAVPVAKKVFDEYFD